MTAMVLGALESVKQLDEILYNAICASYLVICSYSLWNAM